MCIGEINVAVNQRDRREIYIGRETRERDEREGERDGREMCV